MYVINLENKCSISFYNQIYIIILGYFYTLLDGYLPRITTNYNIHNLVLIIDFHIITLNHNRKPTLFENYQINL